MNGLLSMIGMQTELEYQMGDDFPFGSPRIRFNVPKGNIPSDKQKCQPKEQITSSSVYNEGAIYFKNKEDAQAVIDNPNFRSILDAIYKD